MDQLAPRDVGNPDVRARDEKLFTGNADVWKLREVIERGGVSVIGFQCFADGQHPFSLANLKAVRSTADRHGLRLVLDASRVVENAWFIQQHETGMASRPIASLVKEIVKTAHVAHLDGAQDPRCPVGGVIMTDNPEDHEKLVNEVVVYEGLHTYGGMAGRVMELMARGIREMVDEDEVDWHAHQCGRFTARLRDAGVPLVRGGDGAYLLASAFLPRVKEHAQDSLSAALYLTSGVRALAHGLVGRDDLVPVQVPRLSMTNRQLDQVADAIVSLHRQRDRIVALEAVRSGRWRDQMAYRSIFADLEPFDLDTIPYVVHTWERVGTLAREGRQRAIETAGYNTFLLRSADVSIDLLTDSGTSAMSTDQWAAYDAARATPCTSDAYHQFVAVLRDVTGYEHVIPTHQGRAAEHVMSEIMIEPGQIVPGNMYFTTTKLHQELAGGVFADVIVDEAHDPRSEHPWKGNIDLGKLRKLVDEHGPRRIAYVSFEHSVNMARGQPVSMDNMKEVYAYCSHLGIPVFFDATRVAENACMIQTRDPHYQNTKIRDILREMLLYGDGCTVSGKKDFLINMGGILAFKDNAEWREKAEELLRVHEGNVTDGGLPAGDLAAMARGVEEMLDDRYIRSRLKQTEVLGRRLLEAGVPIVTPPGSHAIFLDARRFLPHLDQDQFPAQRLAAEIFVETGVRAMERGNVSKGRDPQTGLNHRPALELVRLTIPRRVYTSDHMRAVAEGIVRLHERRHGIGGLRFVYEPAKLRFFQGRFEPVDA
jgi:tyrosine phenol-lyase